MKPSGSRKKTPRPYQKHGLTRLMRAVSEANGRGLRLDRRTRIGRALHAFSQELVEDHGGLEAVSARQRGLVLDVAVPLKLLIDSGVGWVLSQKTLVNSRRRAFHPIVGELASLLSRYQSVMKDLGLPRKPKPVPSLAEYLDSLSEEGQGEAEQEPATREPVQGRSAPPGRTKASGKAESTTP
jgi:hypothetical protein